MDLDGISTGPGSRTPSVASYASSFGGARASPKTFAPRERQRHLHSPASGQLARWSIGKRSAERVRSGASFGWVRLLKCALRRWLGDARRSTEAEFPTYPPCRRVREDLCRQSETGLNSKRHSTSSATATPSSIP